MKKMVMGTWWWAVLVAVSVLSQVVHCNESGFHTLQFRSVKKVAAPGVPSKNVHGLVSSGMSLVLMHKNAAGSPFRFQNATVKSMLTESLKRDILRVAGVRKKIDLAVSGYSIADLTVPMSTMDAEPMLDTASDPLTPVTSGSSLGSGEYFARLEVGTPGVGMYLSIDTGNDVLWLQCWRCSNCYPQYDPYYHPDNSKSFSNVLCGDEFCKDLESSGCYKKNCLYQVSYSDGSFTVGEFATETFTLGSVSKGSVSLPHIAFGCGHDNEGVFAGAAGVLGLGKGPLSFPSQVKKLFSNMFSYCLVNQDAPSTDSSSLIFGDAALPTTGVIFTPQVYNKFLPSYYYVELVGISVGGILLQIPDSAFQLDSQGGGGVIVDSGTSITHLSASAYYIVRDAFRAGSSSLPRAPPYSLFDTCYNLSNYTSVDVPKLAFHFGGGADVDLPASNYVLAVDDAGTYCLALAPTSNNSTFSIIGNVQQHGYRVVYDNQNFRIGFQPGQCS